MNTNPTNRKAVEDLTVGEHVADAQGVHRVIHSLPFRNGDGQRHIALMLDPIGSGQPWVARHPEGYHLTLATDELVRDHREIGRRAAAADALRQLADDIVRLRLSVSEYSLRLSAGVLRSRAELDRWAVYLGAEVRGGTPGDPIPAVNGSRPVMDGMVLSIQAQIQPAPQPATTDEQSGR